MGLWAWIAVTPIGSVSVQAGGAITFAFVTICTMWFITGVTFTHRGSVSWPTCLAIGGINGAADAVGVSTGKGKIG